jgi:hypothetical protein
VVSDRTGSDLVELAILETLSAATAGRPRAHVVCTKAVAAIEERIGLGPRYGYEVLLDLARPWIIPVPTVSVMGNKGDRTFPEAAWPEHTECRPSHAGQVVLDAETHRLAPVPVGIINGTAYRGGIQPPLEPLRVLAALRRLLEDPRVPDGEVLGIVGLPYSTAGCQVTGDLDALMKGRRVVVRETAKIIITGVPVPPVSAEPPPPVSPRTGIIAVGHAFTGPPSLRHPAHLVIESLPARTSNPQADQAIISRVRPPSWADSPPPLAGDLAPDPGLPIEDITDQASQHNDVRIVIALRPGADPVAVRDQLAVIDGITTEATWKFPAPLASMLRSWVDRYRGEDTTASLVSLEDAIRRDRRREQRDR